MNEVSQTLQQQGSPILLLAYLHRTFPGLPHAEFHTSAIYNRLDVSIHEDLGAFEMWRVALGLGSPVARSCGGTAWLVIEGVVADVPVCLVGFAAADDIEARTELVSA